MLRKELAYKALRIRTSDLLASDDGATQCYRKTQEGGRQSHEPARHVRPCDELEDGALTTSGPCSILVGPRPSLPRSRQCDSPAAFAA